MLPSEYTMPAQCTGLSLGNLSRFEVLHSMLHHPLFLVVQAEAADTVLKMFAGMVPSSQSKVPIQPRYVFLCIPKH
jgi:hypothetical protein